MTFPAIVNNCLESERKSRQQLYHLNVTVEIAREKSSEPIDLEIKALE